MESYAFAIFLIFWPFEKNCFKKQFKDLEGWKNYGEPVGCVSTAPRCRLPLPYCVQMHMCMHDMCRHVCMHMWTQPGPWLWVGSCHTVGRISGLTLGSGVAMDNDSGLSSGSDVGICMNLGF